MLRKRITVLASVPGTNKECDNFAVLSLTIRGDGSIDLRGAGYDNTSFTTKLSKLITKMPGIKNKTGVTFFQEQMEVLKESILRADEIIVGNYRRDVGLVNKLFREYKGTSINDKNQCVIQKRNKNIRELFYEIPDSVGKPTYRKLAEWSGIDPEVAVDIAKSIFDEDYWQDMPSSAIKAALLLLVRLDELGYEQNHVADTIANYMDDYYEVGEATPCYLRREAFYGEA